MPSAGYRHDVVALSQYPGKRELGCRAVVFFCNFLDPSDQIQILLEVLTHEARMLPAEIVLGEIFDAFDLAGQESATERTVSDETNVERSKGLEQAVFRVATPE